MTSYINFSIQSREELQDWILKKLGYPLVTVELATEQLDTAIDDALEFYTEYATIQEDYILLDLSDYVVGVGISLSAYGAKSIFSMDEESAAGGINTLFSFSNQLANQGIIPFQGGAGGSLLSYELACQYMELVKRMTGGRYDFNYNPRRQILKLFPDPKEVGRDGYMVVGAHVIPPLEDLYGEHYVKKLALASAKMMLGTIRSKFDGVVLPGGGTIDASIGDEGRDEWDKWTDDVVALVGPHSAFFIG